MFHKKVQINEDNGIIQKVDQDLIVHNMPDQKRLMGNGILPKTEVSSNFQEIKPKKNFKIVGGVIIGGGFIVIGLLIYFSYSLIIKPAAKPVVYNAPLKVDAIVDQATNTVAVNVPVETINISTTTQAATSSIVDFNVATTSSMSSSSLDILNGASSDTAPPLLDTDNDGLYDEEEVALGTNINIADSDLDGYSDKTELEGGYNPNGPGKLVADSFLSKYANKDFNYEILYSKNWTLKEAPADNSVIFTSSDDSIIQVSVQDNSQQLGIMSWYSDAFPNSSLTYDKLKSGATWDGVSSEDNLNFYLTDKKHQKIYIISYIPFYSNRLAYPSYYKAIINSLVLK